MTDAAQDKDNKGKQQTQSASTFSSDPRIRALVRFLARRAAEADYADLLEGKSARRPNPTERRNP